MEDILREMNRLRAGIPNSSNMVTRYTNRRFLLDQHEQTIEQQQNIMGLFLQSMSTSGGNKSTTVPVELLPTNNVDIRILAKNTDKILDGKFFLCRTIANAFKMTSVMSVVEDPKGDQAIRLALYNYSFSETGDTIESLYQDLPVAQILIIKNPWFKSTRDGGFTLRCDNPSEVILLADLTFKEAFPSVQWEGSIPSKWKKFVKKQPESAAEWKGKGNQLFVAKKFQMAIEAYTEGFKRKDLNDQIMKDLLSNRALAYISLRCFATALDDCNQLLTMDPNHTKGIYRKAKTLCGLQRFVEAIELLNFHLPKMEDKTSFELQIRCAQGQLHQQTTGEYDFAQLQAAEKTKIHDDVADYTGPVRLAEITGKGRGLVASRSIDTGELLILSNAFAVVFPEDNKVEMNLNFETGLINTAEQDKLVKEVVKRLKLDPQSGREVYALHAGPGITSSATDGQHVTVDMKRIHGICTYNAFSGNLAERMSRTSQPKTPDAFNKSSSTGLWILPSYINHSCWDCNSSWRIYGNLLIVRSFKPIKEGDEILISYISPTELDRKRFIKKHGFCCVCQLCLLDANESADGRMRMELLQKMSIKSSMGMEHHEMMAVMSMLKKLDKLNITCNPSLVTTLTPLALQFFLQKNFQQASKLLLRCHSIAKDSPLVELAVDSAINLVGSYLMVGNVEEAKKWIPTLKSDLMICYGTLEVVKTIGKDTLSLMDTFGLTF